VLWCCWFGGRTGIRACKKTWVVGYWHGHLSGARCRLAYGPADATATHCLLFQQNPDSFTMQAGCSLFKIQFTESIEYSLICPLQSQGWRIERWIHLFIPLCPLLVALQNIAEAYQADRQRWHLLNYYLQYFVAVSLSSFVRKGVKPVKQTLLHQE